MSTDDFTKLSNHIDARFDKLEGIIAKKSDESDLQRVLNALDAMGKKQVFTDTARADLKHELDKVYEAIAAVAKRVEGRFKS